MNKGVKFRAYPTKEQQNLINQTFGCCRFVYNWGPAVRKDAYKANKRIGYVQTSAMLTQLKRLNEFAFLKTVDSAALQQSLRDLDRAFKNFFEKHARYPRFKSKRIHRQSYRTVCLNNNIRIEGKYIKLPKVGYVKIKQSMKVEHINNVTIEITPTGKYFVVLNVDFEPERRTNEGCAIGIDVGIKEFYSDSNGRVVDNPKYLEKSERKLIRAQRKLSRKKKGSNNYNKQRIRLAKVHEKIANQRNDFLQKQSTMLISENQTICIEDLDIKGMVRNHKFAKSISSASWGKFFTMLRYKAAWYGNDVIEVPTMYPSSQICNCCGYKNPVVKNLAVRQWECPKCHTKHNRDINASINTLKKGLSII